MSILRRTLLDSSGSSGPLVSALAARSPASSSMRRRDFSSTTLSSTSPFFSCAESFETARSSFSAIFTPGCGIADREALASCGELSHGDGVYVVGAVR